MLQAITIEMTRGRDDRPNQKLPALLIEVGDARLAGGAPGLQRVLGPAEDAAELDNVRDEFGLRSDDGIEIAASQGGELCQGIGAQQGILGLPPAATGR